jgi:hypothetical protein
MVGFSLQQDGDADAAPGCRIERPGEADAGEEVGVGDEDFFAGIADCAQVGVQDVVAVADVVADQESNRGGRSVSGGSGA